MKVTYDPTVDAMSIDFAKGTYHVSREINKGSIIVDFDKKGKLLSIEILDASINIPSFDPKNIVVSQTKTAVR